MFVTTLFHGSLPLAHEGAELLPLRPSWARLCASSPCLRPVVCCGAACCASAAAGERASANSATVAILGFIQPPKDIFAGISCGVNWFVERVGPVWHPQSLPKVESRAPFKTRSLRFEWESTNPSPPAHRQVARSSAPKITTNHEELRPIHRGLIAMSGAGGPVKVFTSGSPTIDRAPSKLRLLQLGWESATVRHLSNALPEGTGSPAETRPIAIRSRLFPRAGSVVPKARPRPVFGLLDQPAPTGLRWI